MWDFFETVRHRHSVRHYQSDLPVEPEKLHAILETACAAPSAGDLQAYRVFVVTNADTRHALAHAAGDQGCIDEAPVCLVFCTDPERSAEQYGDRGRHLYALQDTTIAAAYTQLAVVAAGMASIWIGHFDEPLVKKTLNIDEPLSPIAMLSLGYPAELPQPTPRRRIDDVVHYLE